MDRQGLVSNPRDSAETLACSEWLESQLLAEQRVCLPEIVDYELRRELLRAGKVRGIRKLDTLKALRDYLPLTTDTMLKAAEFWAIARRRGRPTAPDAALDADMILAAQAALAPGDGGQVVIATTNIGHLSLFADARRWQDIV